MSKRIRTTIARGFSKPPRQIITAAMTVSAMGGVVMLFSALRDLVIAYEFGRSDTVDAFFVALILPTLAIQALAGSLATAAAPHFIALRERGHESSAYSLARQLGTIAIGMFSITIAILIIANYPILRILTTGFSPEKGEMVRLFYFMFLPVVLIQGWSNFVGPLINAQNRFAVVALAPVLRPLLVIALILWAVHPVHPVWLGTGYLLGTMLEAVVIAGMAISVGIPIAARWPRPDAPTSAVLREFAPVFASTLIVASGSVFNQYLASLLAPGSVAALNYGSKLVSLIVSLGAVPIAVAVLPHFSRQASRLEWAELYHTLINLTALIILICIPTILALIYYSGPITRLMFQRGAFTYSDTLVVAGIQSYLLLHVPFYLANILFVRALIVIRSIRFVTISAAVSLAINMIASLLLMHVMGVAGLALGITLGGTMGSILSGYFAVSMLRTRATPTL